MLKCVEKFDSNYYKMVNVCFFGVVLSHYNYYYLVYFPFLKQFYDVRMITF